MDTNTSLVQSFSVEKGDGKGVITPEGHRMIKVAGPSTSASGKGKGKTVQFCLIPAFGPLTSEDWPVVSSMVHSMCLELQKDIVVRIAKTGTAAVPASELTVQACAAEYAARSFTAESIAVWFVDNVQDLLALDYATHKGFDLENLTDAQKLELTQVCNAWRDSYADFGNRFPKVDSAMYPQLKARILKYELDDAIAVRLIDALTPKVTLSALGGAF